MRNPYWGRPAHDPRATFPEVVAASTIDIPELAADDPVGFWAEKEARSNAPARSLWPNARPAARRARYLVGTVRRLLLLLVMGMVAAVGIFAATNDVSVVQPIGAVPDGVTLVVTKTANIRFVDSADALCDRKLGGVSLLCRGMALSAVLEAVKVRARLPYMDWLYLLSTGGKRFAQ